MMSAGAEKGDMRMVMVAAQLLLRSISLIYLLSISLHSISLYTSLYLITFCSSCSYVGCKIGEIFFGG